MFKELINLFRPSIPDEAQTQANRALQVIRTNQQVKEVRVFGSATNGRWNKKRQSDVDMAVIIEGNDPEWSAYNRPNGVETDTRKSLRKSVKEIAPRVELHLATDADIQIMNEEGGVRCADGFILHGMHKKMLRGKAIFTKEA